MIDFPAMRSDPEAHIALVRAYLNNGRSEALLRDLVAKKHALSLRALSDEAVLEVWRRIAAGENHYAIARSLGVDSKVIANIVHGLTYREVAA